MFKALATGMLGVFLLAAPAIAAPLDLQVERPLAWVVAPLDNEPHQPLMFMGVAKVQANEGVLDRALRVVAGAGLIYLGAANPTSMPVGGQVAADGVGAILALTAVTGYCPLYDLVGITTR